MIRLLLLGREFSDSNALNTLIMLVEIAAVMGFYAAPNIICRFAIKQKPFEKNHACRFNIVWTVIWGIIVITAIVIFKISALTVLGIIIWYPFNKAILTVPDCDSIPKIKATGITGFIAAVFSKYQEIAVYIIVGIIATIVSWGVYYIISKFLDSSNPVYLTVNTILNWTAGVLVAYPMNRSWVFKSKSPEKGKEFLKFVLERVATLIIEEIVMIVLVDILGVNQYISKYAVASVLVIILNYVFSKVFVFKKEKQ